MEDGSTDAANGGQNNEEIHWRFSQIKGIIEEQPTDVDLISCVEFSDDGEYLATGDKVKCFKTSKISFVGHRNVLRCGRVVIFQRNQAFSYSGARSSEFNVYSTFQSHEPEFDYLKSLEIEEKINQIKWLKKKNQANFIISTNDKTIKLWKISERERRVAEGNYNLINGTAKRSSDELVLPKLEPMELVVEASPRRVYANAHTYHVNSISVNSDQETFLSADDLRINLWHHEITNQSFNIVDIKPQNMEELTEVITSAEFHPNEGNYFAYSSSKGIIRLCDTRINALCDKPARVFEEHEDPSTSIILFGNHLQHFGFNIWDLANERQPCETYNVHDYLRSKLCTLYENDSIFDKFECNWSGDDSHIITGSYSNYFRVFKRNSPVESTYEASLELCKLPAMYQKKKGNLGLLGRKRKEELFADNLDFSKKILHSSWNPSSSGNIIALAATNNLFIFEGITC
ncbi:Serine/threonine-protein phosphatase 2A 55 kDa regulatory subunit B [Aphelenchoides bicaudatus]|nr:Serine/threonine-protein phosphatase 2A 55 kDa regulatory subunit B [Aphelenchoides bicaudatus]